MARNTSRKAVLNLGGNETSECCYINILKMFGLGTSAFANPADASRLDANGYLTSTPAGAITLTSRSKMWPGVQYKLAWPATRTFRMILVGAITLVSSSNATTSGGSGNDLTVSSTGSAGHVIFTMTGTSINVQWPASGTYAAGSGEVALYRVSDEAAYLAGEVFTPELITLIKGLRPTGIRPMGWVMQGDANFNNETTWAYRAKPTSFSWRRQIPPGAWGGALSGTNSYTGSAAPDTPGSWTDGETWIGYAPSANTSTTVTINIGGRGAKTVVRNTITAGPEVGAIAANVIGTYVYKSVLDVVVFDPAGIIPSTPIEVQAKLANQLDCDLWGVIPTWATDDYVTQWGTMLHDGGGGFSGLANKLFAEYSNEVWNFQFPQTTYANEMGKALGWVEASNQALYGYYSLRLRQIMGNLLPPVWADSMSRLKRVMDYQGGGDTSQINNRFKGIQLVPGDTEYNALTGSANYSASPDRPIDVCEVIAYAPYAGGTQLCYGPDNSANYTPTVAMNQAPLQAIVDAWDAGNSAAAIALVDADIREGRMGVQTVTGSGTTFTTPVAHGLPVQSRIWFDVSGGSMASGVTARKLYQIASVPTTTTFTMQEIVGNNASGSAINAGAAGTGVMNVGRTQVTLLDITRMHKFAESLAALFDADRPAGMASLEAWQYEGNLEPQGPTSVQCASIGLTGADPAASIAAAIVAWKNDAKAATLQKDYFRQAVGEDSSEPLTYGLVPHVKAGSQLVLLAPSVWAMTSGSYPDDPPHKMYDGFRDFILYDESSKRRWGVSYD